jgi:MFS family permease
MVPLSIFRIRNVAGANVVGVVMTGAKFAWFFTAALYLQLVMGYSPFQVGLAFLPSNIIMAICGVGLSAPLVIRFGTRGPLIAGALVNAAGLASFVTLPVHPNYFVHLLPGMLLLGIGSGITMNPMLIAATSDAPRGQEGLASGLVNTSFMLGGAVGLAAFASIAASRTATLVAEGHSHLAALAGGYRATFLVASLVALLAAALAAVLLRPTSRTTLAPAVDPVVAAIE